MHNLDKVFFYLGAFDLFYNDVLMGTVDASFKPANSVLSIAPGFSSKTSPIDLAMGVDSRLGDVYVLLDKSTSEIITIVGKSYLFTRKNYLKNSWGFIGDSDNFTYNIYYKDEYGASRQKYKEINYDISEEEFFEIMVLNDVCTYENFISALKYKDEISNSLKLHGFFNVFSVENLNYDLSSFVPNEKIMNLINKNCENFEHYFNNTEIYKTKSFRQFF